MSRMLSPAADAQVGPAMRLGLASVARHRRAGGVDAQVGLAMRLRLPSVTRHTRPVALDARVGAHVTAEGSR